MRGHPEAPASVHSQHNLPPRSFFKPPSSAFSSQTFLSPLLGDDAFQHESFLYKWGTRSHPYPMSSVPYPYTCDFESIDSEVMREHLIRRLAGIQVSVLEHQSSPPPKISLDVGCGRGYWITRSAAIWTSTQFVGFDISPVQPSPESLDKSCRSRIKWVHGNFLERWPFHDNTFDHVRIAGCSQGVPETKWDFFFSELWRVMTPGGKLEWYDEDIVTPRVLPFPGDPITSRPNSPESMFYPKPSFSLSELNLNPKQRQDDGSQPAPDRVQTPLPELNAEYDPRAGYDDNVFEALYNEMFKIRGINPNPTSILPFYINGWFNATMISPGIRMPIPHSYNAPPPPPPPPRPLDTREVVDPNRKRSRNRQSQSTIKWSDSPEPFYALTAVNVSGIPHRPIYLPPRTVVLRQEDILTHHKVAIDTMSGILEAIWDWIVSMENWQEVSPRDPVIKEARYDLEKMFNVFKYRLQRHLDHSIDHNFPPLLFTKEALDAVDIDHPSASNGVLPTVSIEKPSLSEESPMSTMETTWVTVFNQLEYLQQEEPQGSDYLDEAELLEDRGRTSSESQGHSSSHHRHRRNPSHKQSIRSRTASVPDTNPPFTSQDFLQSPPHTYQPHSNPLAASVPSSSSPLRNATSSESFGGQSMRTDTSQAPPSQSHAGHSEAASHPPLISVNGPNAEDTIHYASRVLRFFYGVKVV